MRVLPDFSRNPETEPGGEGMRRRALFLYGSSTSPPKTPTYAVPSGPSVTGA